MTEKFLRSLATVGTAAFFVLGLGSAANALSCANDFSCSFSLAGVTDPTNNTADVTFAYDGTNKLTIDITNTANGFDPRLTNFVFNAPTEVTGVTNFMASGTGDDSDWNAVFDPDDINTPGNFGKFDIGGLTQGTDATGGTANSGIIQNMTGSFMITLLGDATDLAGLTALSFLNLLSTMDNNGTDPQFFGARFQRTGFCTQLQVLYDDCDPDGSDIAFPTPMTPVPVPAALPLFLTALAGAGFMARRRRQTA